MFSSPTVERFVLPPGYLLIMETTLTIRLPAKQREALRRRAAAEKRSESALVRDLIGGKSSADSILTGSVIWRGPLPARQSVGKTTPGGNTFAAATGADGHLPP